MAEKDDSWDQFPSGRFINTFAHGADTSGMRPSENVEDARGRPPPVPTPEQLARGVTWDPDNVAAHPAAASPLASAAGSTNSPAAGLEQLRGGLERMAERMGGREGPRTIPAPISAGGPQLEVSPAGARAYYDPESHAMRLRGDSAQNDEAMRSRGWAPGIPQDIIDKTERERMEDRLALHGREQLIEGPPGHERDPELNSFAEAFTAIHPLHDTEIAGLKEAAAGLHPHERTAALASLRWAKEHGLTREDLERYGHQRMAELQAAHEPQENWFGRMAHHFQDTVDDPHSWWNRMRPTHQSIFDLGSAGAAEK